MAKFGLIFICVLVMVQLSLAIRAARDAPETATPKKTETEDPTAFNLNEALATISQAFQKTFSKENVDKLMVTLGETGESLKQFGEGLIDKAQKKAAEMSNAAKKEDAAKTEDNKNV